jgi:hypothetical protein
MTIQTIEGGMFADDRGKLRFVNGFDFKKRKEVLSSGEPSPRIH